MTTHADTETRPSKETETDGFIDAFVADTNDEIAQFAA